MPTLHFKMEHTSYRQELLFIFLWVEKYTQKVPQSWTANAFKLATHRLFYARVPLFAQYSCIPTKCRDCEAKALLMFS